MNQLYKILSILLTYPNEDIVSSIPEIKKRLSGLEVDGSALSDLLDYMQERELIPLQEQYVQTFDRTPSHSLHLFEHLYGEDRSRGQAMVDLLEEYKSNGFEVIDNELPDYLPLFLEFLSICSGEESTVFLDQAIHIIAHIGKNLEKNQSPYAGVFTVLESLSQIQIVPITAAPIRSMDEMMEKFGPNVQGIEPLLDPVSVQPIHFYPRQTQ